MKNFKIEFNDIDGNDVYSVTKQFDSVVDAINYARIIIATSSDECVDFNIIEL